MMIYVSSDTQVGRRAALRSSRMFWLRETWLAPPDRQWWQAHRKGSKTPERTALGKPELPIRAASGTLAGCRWFRALADRSAGFPACIPDNREMRPIGFGHTSESSVGCESGRMGHGQHAARSARAKAGLTRRSVTPPNPARPSLRRGLRRACRLCHFVQPTIQTCTPAIQPAARPR